METDLDMARRRSDWQPVIGEIADGIFVDAGTSGHGFKLVPALGKGGISRVTGATSKVRAQVLPDSLTSGNPAKRSCEIA